ncbi:MAG: alpha-glucan family phosphorylase [Bacteroidales bacterium]|nr:alpha-glucan family phosphorylase [Bacteroidales bacterium]
MTEELIKPEYLFEASWEVCNKVGGIHTVVATKAPYLKKELGRHHILIGPDVWMHTRSNPDFIEDSHLFSSWRAQAASEGLRVRTGRWNIPGRPIAILVDFKQYLPHQNDILTQIWLDFGVDSISGNWDYKENILFGFAAGRVIESFYRFNLGASDKVVAQFHEWQTGAGLLYVKKTGLPIATVFTTHATMMGRCVAGNNLPLYDAMSRIDADEKARQFNVVAIQSVEKTTALQADIFTTVSGITAMECEHFLSRKCDVITPNGFENSFVPSDDKELSTIRTAARGKLLKVASAMSGEEIGEDALLVGTGGRYEFRNKGIDVFIDALAGLAAKEPAGRTIAAFIMIPAGHNGPDRDLLAKLEGSGSDYVTQVSHTLASPEYDLILNRIKELGLVNAAGSRIKVFFIPSYLNGDDGIFNMPYYALLSGLDTTAFPSYYEPWGYTPLESLAFSVPSLTTSLAGFGLWIREHYEGDHPGITVLDRNESNYDAVVEGAAARLEEISSLDPSTFEAYRRNARKVSETVLWDSQIQYYKEAYSKALAKIAGAGGLNPDTKETPTTTYKKMNINNPSWRSVMVTRHLPEAISGLETLSKNLWWCWNESAKSLFESIDPAVWAETIHNPMALLDVVSLKKFKALAKDEEFLASYRKVMDEFNVYMAAKAERKDPMVGYFCMEYGLDTSLKIYSGGLGLLAGDYLKETSDMNVNLVAVGLLYRYGYFTQTLTGQGEQVAQYDAQDFTRIPAEPVLDSNGEWVTSSIAFPGRTVTARIWKVAVGRTDLYLLDTDYEANLPEDRQITYHLYGGDWENRLKQELLLGIGGLRALRQLGLNPQIYHYNEGHAAFTGLERLREYINNDNLDFGEAIEVVRASSLFTTHTPVPAGHDSFDEGLLRQYIGHFPQLLKIDWETMMGLGKINASDQGEKFSMSFLAANCSQNVNGVSWLHGEVSKDIFNGMYPGYLPEELYISYVTNGVHYPTWAAAAWKKIHAKVFGPDFQTQHYDKSCFEGIYKVPDDEIWEVRKALKSKLVRRVNKIISNPKICNHYSPSQIVTIKENLRDDVLTIGFARRFATYKRGTLLFSDLDRLDAIVNNPERPVQFLFAGKAHPADKAGQDLIKRIVEISKDERFLGKIIFVPGYDISLAKRLVQGVDVWMNTPTRPLEASGTSGEKASMNGVMHFSVLDGWWVEGYKEGAGWALPQQRSYDDQGFQNDLDAATIYTLIENEIAPAYYAVDKSRGFSTQWVGYIKNTIAGVACNFTTNRMLTDYCNQFYIPQDNRTSELVADDYCLARKIAAWKKRLRKEWNNIEIVSQTQPSATYSLTEHNPMDMEVVLDLGDLLPEDIGVEILFATSDEKQRLHIQEKIEFEVASFEDGVATYRTSILPDKTGMYQVATRMYAKNPLLPHRQDFELVRWL